MMYIHNVILVDLHFTLYDQKTSLQLPLSCDHACTIQQFVVKFQIPVYFKRQCYFSYAIILQSYFSAILLARLFCCCFFILRSFSCMKALCSERALSNSLKGVLNWRFRELFPQTPNPLCQLCWMITFFVTGRHVSSAFHTDSLKLAAS